MNLRSINPAEIAILVGIAVVTAVFFVDLSNYSSATRLVPFIFIISTAVLLALRIAMIVYRATHPENTIRSRNASEDEDGQGIYSFSRSLWVLGSLVSYIVLIWLVGMYPTILLFVLIFSRLFGPLNWLHAAILAVATAGLSYLIFGLLLRMPPMEGVLF